MKTFDRIKQWAKACKRDLRVLLLVMKHPRTPWYAKLWLAGVAAYALSPIDLIPDFIPVLGYLDDLLLLPVGIWIGIKMVPSAVITECRNAAIHSESHPAKRSLCAALVIICLWATAVAATAYLVLRLYRTM